MILLALTTLITFLVMEGITWCTHKFVMHGFLWYLHEDHHQPKYKNLFEKNDLFFIIFALMLIEFMLQNSMIKNTNSQIHISHILSNFFNSRFDSH